MAVKVSNVSKLYGKQRALDNVSFEINSGQVAGFLGPNGAGKSTMMKIICCYLPQNEGSITVNGFDTLENSIEVRKNVGYLPEHNPLYHDMYVREYLSFIGSIHLPSKSINSRVNKMIEITGLGMEQKKKIGALSKGYRQRVGLAQAMIHDPEVLILDEPTSGLDPNQLSEIRSLIREIGKEKTVILSTHIMQEVEAICNRVLIIDKGKIVADDTTDVLRQKVASENIYHIEFDKDMDAALINGLAGVIRSENAGNHKWKITARGETDIRADLFKVAVENQLTVLSLQKEESKLEDVFHLLTSYSQS